MALFTFVSLVAMASMLTSPSAMLTRTRLTGHSNKEVKSSSQLTKARSVEMANRASFVSTLSESSVKEILVDFVNKLTFLIKKKALWHIFPVF